MQANAGEDEAQRRARDEEEGEGSGGDGDGGDGCGGREAARSGDSAGGGQEEEWGEMMGECSREETEHSSNGSGAVTGRQVGVGKARERAGPGKRRRVATLARWEPSARAHMLACLDDATIDVTGD